MTDEPIRLKTIHRDIRVTAGRIPFAPGGMHPSARLHTGTAQDFAQQITARYAVRRRWLPGLERILRRLGIGVVQHVTYNQHQIRFEPRVHLALNSVRAEAAQSRALPGEAPPIPDNRDISRTIRESLLTARTLTFARRISQQVHSLERRLVTRTTRVGEATAAGSPANGNGILRHPVARVAPVPRVLVQSGPVPSVEPSLPAVRPVPESGWSAAPASVAPPDMASPPALEQITEQVLQRIEQRLVAHRERMGRG